jgi:hypothetical protein
VKDWVDWHSAYDDPDTRLARRLTEVRAALVELLDVAPAGPLRVVSMCAGQGRDLIGALAGHPRRHEVTARLVELDPRNTAAARAGVRRAGLTGVEVVTADAALTDSYAGAVPADIVLACGVFGNISDADVARTIGALPGFVAAGGAVIWTRHRGEPDLVPAIQGWFAASGFTPVSMTDKAAGYGVGVHRFTGTPRELAAGERLFTFVGEPSDQP